MGFVGETAGRDHLAEVSGLDKDGVVARNLRLDLRNGRLVGGG
jgi:hypothetical protein